MEKKFIELKIKNIWYILMFISCIFLSCKSENNKTGNLNKHPANHTVKDFKLLSQNGDTFYSKTLNGKIYVADFFFTTCPGICKSLTTQMQKVQREFINDDSLILLSFSVDPDKDTFEVLQRYADMHNAIKGKWYFLRGTNREMMELARDEYQVIAEDDTSNYLIHSEKLTLVNKNGNIYGHYNGLDTSDVNKLITDIKLLRKKSKF